MRTVRILRYFFGVMLMVLVAPALAYTITGTIYGNSSPLPGVQLQLRQTGGETALGSTLTDASGQYSFADVGNGIYDLMVTPPAGSGFGSTSVSGISVADGNVTQNVVLITGASTLSGTLSGLNGRAVEGVSLRVIDQATGTELASVRTDAAGGYSVALAEGTYKINATYYPAEGGAYYLEPIIQDVIVSSNVSKDLVLPLATLSGRTTDANGVAVGGVPIATSAGWLNSSAGYVRYFANYTSAVSDASGHYSLRVLQGLNAVTLSAPAGSAFANTLVNDVVINGDTSRDLVLASKRTLSGTLRDLNGQAVGRVSLRVMDQATGTELASVMTDAAGGYAVTLAEGTYKVNATYYPAEGGAFFLDPIIQDVVVSGDVSKDLVMPLATLSGRTTDAHGVAIAGVRVAVNSSWSNSLTGYGRYFASYASAVSDADGHYSLRVLLGLEAVTLSPPAASSFASTLVNGLVINGNTSRDLVLASKRTLSGTLRGLQGQAVEGVSLRMMDQATGTELASAMTDATGGYSVILAEGTYKINAAYYPVGGSAYYLEPIIQDVVVSGDVSKDLVLPLATLSGRTTDSNGVAVGGVQIATSSGWSNNSEGYGRYFSNYTSAVSDASGNYSLRVLVGLDAVVVTPPTGSGFSTTVVNGLKIAGSLRQNIILMFADTRTPIVVSDPRATGITASSAIIEWQTDEPATSTVTMNGVSYTVEGYRTHHAIAVDGLSAGLAHTANISSSDRAGNGPVTASVTFSTLASADTRAPMLLSGPVVTAIGHDRATIAWQTDEAATTQLRYGVSEPVSEVSVPGLRDVHEIELPGLVANTLYTVRVSATDSAGNGPTHSHLVQFRTLPQPDASAPVITSGPVITQVSNDSVTIVWETDEAASSGVSLNDGVSYQVVRDEHLSTLHSVHVTGLQASTLYNYVVSSTDGRGNGPTLSLPATFTTLVTPDTLAPVLVGGLRVVGITHQSAVVQWRTDELADSTVEFGLDAGVLSRTVSDARLSSQHIVHLTALEADTEYFLRAHSVDAAGNVMTTTIGSFHTHRHPDTVAPRFTAPPAVIGVTDTTVTLAWETDEPADFMASYGVDDVTERSRASGERDNQHHVTLARLVPGQAYRFAIMATDTSGNVARYESPPAVVADARESVDSFGLVMSLAGVEMAHAHWQPPLASPGGFRTANDADRTPPAFTSAPDMPWTSSDRVLLRWSADEPVSAQIRYGVQGSPAMQVTGELNPGMMHATLLTNLQPASTYAYEVRLRDVAGNEFVQSGTFVTATLTDVVAPEWFSRSVVSRDDGSFVLDLGTSEPAEHEVQFGLDPAALTERVFASGYDTVHAVVLSTVLPSLEAGSVTHYRVISTDPAGNRSEVTGQVTTLSTASTGGASSGPVGAGSTGSGTSTSTSISASAGSSQHGGGSAGISLLGGGALLLWYRRQSRYDVRRNCPHPVCGSRRPN